MGLALRLSPLGRPFLGYVPNDLAIAAQPAAIVIKRRDGDMRQKLRTILAPPPVFRRKAPEAARGGKVLLRLSLRNRFHRIEQGSVLSDHLRFRPAFQASCAFVPDRDLAVWIEHVNGIAKRAVEDRKSAE